MIAKIEGKLVTDLNGKEDNSSEADLAFAMMPSKGLVTLLQMDGTVSKDELLKLLDMAVELNIIEKKGAWFSYKNQKTHYIWDKFVADPRF